VTAQAIPTLPDPDAAVSYLADISPQLRGCAILDEAGSVLASRGDGDDAEWQRAAGALMSAVDGAGGDKAAHAHIATPDGEVFLVRQGGLIAIAGTERFVLASLMVFDLRAVLRELAGGGAG
jgi:hypothetical protein